MTQQRMINLTFNRITERKKEWEELNSLMIRYVPEGHTFFPLSYKRPGSYKILSKLISVMSSFIPILSYILCQF